MFYEIYEIDPQSAYGPGQVISDGESLLQVLRDAQDYFDSILIENPEYGYESEDEVLLVAYGDAVSEEIITIKGYGLTEYAQHNIWNKTQTGVR